MAETTESPTDSTTLHAGVHPRIGGRTRPRHFGFALLIALASYALVPHPGYFSPRYGVVEFVRGDAYNPFARRALPSLLAIATAAATPAPLRARIDAAVESRLRPPAGTPPAAPGYGTALLAAIAWSVLALAAFYLLVGRTAALALGERGAGPFVLFTALLWTAFTHFSVFIYDPLVMALWAGLVLAVVRERAAMVTVLAIACALTKETAIAIPLAAWLVAPARHRLSTFAWRALAVVAVQAALVYVFRGRHGSVLENHLHENVAAALQWRQWFQFEPFGPTVGLRGGLALMRPIGINLLLWPPLFALGMAGWRDASRPVRWAVAVVVLAAIPAHLVVGMLHEIRALYELLPWGLWLLALGLARVLHRRPA